MNLHSDGIFQAFSAGSNPASSPHPMTLSILRGSGSNDVKNHAKGLIHCLY